MTPSGRPRCLVVHPGALGDVLLSAPALAHLGALGFCATLAVSARLVGLFRASGLVADARDLDDFGLHRLFVEEPISGIPESLAGYDAIVSWLGAGDPVYTARLARCGRPAVVARAVPPPGSSRHAAGHLLETLAPLGPPPRTWPDARLGVSVAECAAARAWLEARKMESGGVIVLQPGAGSPAKAWPGFADLATRLRDLAVPVVALAGPADGPMLRRLATAGAVDEGAVAREWPLPRIAALLSLARATVGNDSGPTHLAAAVGCPTVAVFGPTDPTVWAPVGPHVQVVASERGRIPWTGVDVGRVEAALYRLLASRGASGPREAVTTATGRRWR